MGLAQLHFCVDVGDGTGVQRHPNVAEGLEARCFNFDRVGTDGEFFRGVDTALVRGDSDGQVGRVVSDRHLGLGHSSAGRISYGALELTVLNLGYRSQRKQEDAQGNREKTHLRHWFLPGK